MAHDWFDKATAVVGVTLLSVIFVVGLLQVMNRHIGLPFDLHWTYEIARTFLALMTIAGLPYLFKTDSDISFLAVLKRVTTRTDAFLLVRNIILIVFSAIMVWSAYLANETTGDVTLPLVSWFKVGWGYLFLGVSFSLIFVFVLVDTHNRINRIRGGSNV